MTTTPLDLLREKRLEQGLPDPAIEQAVWRRALLQGSLIGALLIVVSVGLTVMLFVRQRMLTAELDRLTLVEAEVKAADSQLMASRSKLKTTKEVNAGLVQGLVNTRSSSALMRDLQRRVPEGVQLTSVEVPPGGGTLNIKGSAIDPLAFARINALQIELARSPLLDPSGVSLRKAVRSAASPADQSPAGGVTFELSARFRPPLPPMAELTLLKELGATGKALRLQQLQSGGLLP
ncbi:MAG: PilN domain-containing protein [Cyanobacteria bacterium K_DeepCast_35m_m2_023]|nr:PilN domain-containing protein [Cyanobacteria bacterium K_DeepCast_35m_m2_023]